MKKKNLNILAAVLVGVAVISGIVLANGRGLMGSVKKLDKNIVNKAGIVVYLGRMLAEREGLTPDELDEFVLCYEDIDGKDFENYACYLDDMFMFDQSYEFNPGLKYKRVEALRLFWDAYLSIYQDDAYDVPISKISPYKDVLVNPNPSERSSYSVISRMSRLNVPEVEGWKNNKFRPNDYLTIDELKIWVSNFEKALR